MYLTGFNDEEFEKYRTWADDPEERVYNYPKLNFPFPQMNPKKLIAPSIRVILGETKLYRNVIPRSHALLPIVKELFQWIKKTHWRLGKRHTLVKQSNKMQPAERM